MKKSIFVALFFILAGFAIPANSQPAPMSPSLMPPSNNAMAVVAPATSNLYVVLSGNGTCNRNGTSSVVPGLKDVVLFDSFNRWLLTSGTLTGADNVIYACYEWLSPQMQFFEPRSECQKDYYHWSLSRWMEGHETSLFSLFVEYGSCSDSFGVY